MKIRSGFVSNSSSSSFLVPLDKFKNVFDLARKMIALRNKDWNEDGFETGPELFEVIDDLEQSGMDPNTSVSFPTTNYNTWIIQTPDGYLVDTCNNHDWIFEGVRAEHIWDFNIPGYTEKDGHRLQDNRVYFLHLGLFGKLVKGHRWYDTCKNCSGYLLKLDDDSVICPVCKGLGDIW
jgi:hypothetical protein